MPTDEDRNVCVVNQVITDTAQQRAPDLAVPPTSGDYHAGVELLGHVDDALSWLGGVSAPDASVNLQQHIHVITDRDK